MRATQDILEVWRRFDELPMETLTKAWYSQIATGSRQRSVEMMRLHREEYGTSGNCFDLAIWLMDEFRKQQMTCHAILTPHSHVAVVVRSERGYRYFCDLGDQWIEPVLIDQQSEEYTEEYLDGFFPAAQIKLKLHSNNLVVTYRRPNGKESKQAFNLTPVPDHELIAAGEKTQRLLSSPLVEKRIFTETEVYHWEFDNYKSFISTNKGRTIEDQLCHLEDWAHRISRVSGMKEEVVILALKVYSENAAQT